jgi:hypothetical protein
VGARNCHFFERSSFHSNNAENELDMAGCATAWLAIRHIVKSDHLGVAIVFIRHLAR